MSLLISIIIHSIHKYYLKGAQITTESLIFRHKYNTLFLIRVVVKILFVPI